MNIYKLNDSLKFEVVISNISNLTASNVIVVLTNPVGAIYDTSSPQQGTITNNNSTTSTWEAGALNAGESRKAEFTFTANLDSTPYVFSWTATTDTPEVDLSNNNGSISIDILGCSFFGSCFTDTTVPSELEKITEGGNTGWRILGKTAANYGDIGTDAVDLSHSNSPSSTKGATGQWSFAAGLNSTASNVGSFAFNNTTIASGIAASAFGTGSEASGTNGFAIGSNTEAQANHSFSGGSLSEASAESSFAMGNYAKANSFASVVIGTFPIESSGQDTNSFVSTDIAFKVGNGTGIGSESDALKLYKNSVQVLGGISGSDLEALTPEEGMFAFVNNGNGGTINSIGFWGYQNGSWTNL